MQHRVLLEVFLAALAKLATSSQILDRPVAPDEAWSSPDFRPIDWSLRLYVRQFDDQAQETQLQDHPDWQRWLRSALVEGDEGSEKPGHPGPERFGELSLWHSASECV